MLARWPAGGRRLAAGPCLTARSRWKVPRGRCSHLARLLLPPPCSTTRAAPAAAERSMRAGCWGGCCRRCALLGVARSRALLAEREHHALAYTLATAPRFPPCSVSPLVCLCVSTGVHARPAGRRAATADTRAGARHAASLVSRRGPPLCIPCRQAGQLSRAAAPAECNPAAWLPAPFCHTAGPVGSTAELGAGGAACRPAGRRRRQRE